MSRFGCAQFRLYDASGGDGGGGGGGGAAVVQATAAAVATKTTTTKLCACGLIINKLWYESRGYGIK